MNTLLTSRDLNQVIKKDIDVSETVMQEQVWEASLEEGNVEEYLGSRGRRTSEAKSGLNHVEAKVRKTAKPYKCPICLKLFHYRKLVRSHLRKHHGDLQRRLEPCPICTRSCKYKSVLSFHMNNHREKVCPICNVVVSDRKALKNHVKSLHIGKVDFVCPICFKLSNDIAGHNDHVSSHDGRQRYECAECSKYYASVEGLERHRHIHGRVDQWPKDYASPEALSSQHKSHLPRIKCRVKCSICSKTLSNLKNLSFHMNRHSGLRPYKCNQCPDTFASPADRSRHLQTHLPVGRSHIYQCSICSKTLSSSRSLRFHMNTHTAKRLYKCRKCPTHYDSPQALKKHRLIHLVLTRKYKCTYCSKSFKRQQLLTNHINTHTGVRPFICNQCPKAYTSAEALSKHRKMHLPGITSRAKCFVCPICSKTLSRSSYLRFHMSIHTGLRPFKCDQCHNSFASPHGLQQHQKGHSRRDRRYKYEYKSRDRSAHCHQCGKVYTDRSSLARHYRNNPSHGSYEHKCSMCSKVFALERSLKDHMKTHFGAPAHKCDECHKEFYSTSGLGRHRRIHFIDSKNLHKCPVCYETFTAKQSLAAHMNIHDKGEDAEPGKVVDLHTALAKYKCKECDKKFISERNLNFHLRLHVKEVIS